MANASGGHFRAQTPQGSHTGQYPFGFGQAGTYYGNNQQSQHPVSTYNNQYYGQPSSQPQGVYPGAHFQQQAYPQQLLHSGANAAFGGHRPVGPPPPPPPPPGEQNQSKAMPVTSASTTPSSFPGYPQGMMRGEGFPPLQPPPLPPMFPWMSPALAESMTCSQYGKQFKEEASNLPFVPIIVNDKDLAKMTENVIKEAEEVTSHQLQYYKDVLNQDLPKALKDLFQPLYCKLCILSLSSPVVAKDHYNGRRHKKAVETWFLKNPGQAKQEKKYVGSHKVDNFSGTSSEASKLINGYQTKQQNVLGPIKGTTSLIPPPPPSLNAQQQPSPSNPAPQRTQPLTERLNSKQNFDRKRPAPPPAPPLMSINTELSPTNIQIIQMQPNNESINIKNFPKHEAKVVSPQIAPTPLPTGNNKSKPPVTETKNIPDNKPTDNKNTTSAQKVEKKALPNQTTASNTNSTAPGGAQPPKKGRLDDINYDFLPEHLRPPKKDFIIGQGGVKGLCRVCNCQLSSPVQAEQHFKGKTHLTRIAAFEEEGIEPPPPILPPPPPPKTEKAEVEEYESPNNVPLPQFSRNQDRPLPFQNSGGGGNGFSIGGPSFNQCNPDNINGQFNQFNPNHNNNNNGNRNNFGNQRNNNNFGKNRFNSKNMRGNARFGRK